MRILYITSEIPYPLTSGYLRHYQFLRGLGERHKVTHVSLTTRSELSEDAVEALNRHVEDLIVFGLPRASERRLRLPLVGRRLQKTLQARRAVGEMKRAVAELLRREPHDLVVFSGKPTFPVVEHLDGVPIVMDCCDATSLRIRGEMRFAGMGRRLALLLRLALVRRMERKLVQKTPHLAFASKRDRAAMTGSPGRGEILPQAIDLEYWRARPARRPSRLLFHGVLRYRPNDDAARQLVEEIAPVVREQVPDLEVFLVGREPTAPLLAAAAEHQWVTLTGEVEDVRPFFDSATVYCAPLRFASGIQNKLLEALAMEVPVVTTPVAADGLAVDGAQPPLVVGGSSAEIAAAIVRLLAAEDERDRLASAGRRFVEEHFAWERSIGKLERMCEEAVTADRGAGRRRPAASGAEEPAG
jgi:glycosyltransferase involved in cell wall biosynthesis